jgi:hypothetical protein
MVATIKDYERYERLSEKAYEYKEKLGDHLREAWELYCDMKLNKSSDYFPQSIDEISKYDNKFVISGTSTYRGCTDYETCSMPVDFVFSDLEGKRAILKKKKEDDAKREEARKKLEAARIADEERETYLRLKAKFEGNE